MSRFLTAGRWIAVILPVLLTLAGCSDYLPDFYYVPRPAVADIPATRPEQPPAITVMAAIIGVHKADAKLAIPQAVHIRIRVQNNQPTPEVIGFDPAAWQLTTGFLIDFDHPILPAPALPEFLPPGQAVSFDAFFPFAPGKDAGNVRLDSLQLKLMLQFDRQRVPVIINFRREIPYYYYEPAWDPYWGYPRYGVWGGTVIYRR